MNWPVIKDIRWLGFVFLSILSAITGVILAVGSNSYWGTFVVLSMVLTGIGLGRTTKLMRESTGD